MRHVTRFILRHQRLVVAAMLVVTGLGIWQRTRLKESQSLQELVVRGDPRRAVFEQMQRDFGDDEILAIAVDAAGDGEEPAIGAPPPSEAAQSHPGAGAPHIGADTVYRREVLDLIGRLSTWLEGLDGVRRVTSLTTTSRLQVASLWGMPVGVEWRPLFDPAAGEAGAAQARDYVRDHPLYRRRLVSPDERSALIVVQFRERDTERINAVTRLIQEGLPRFEGEGVRLWLAGYPLIRSELIRASRQDVNRLLLVALAVIVAILVVSFRRVGPVLLAATVIVAGVTVASGAIAALGIRMNNLLAMVPALVLIIGSSVSMHLLTRYRAERQCGANEEGAAARALLHAGPRCFWASATTAIGFLGLITSRVPALRQCGICSAIGVMLTFGMALAAVPAALTLWRRGRLRRLAAGGGEGDPMPEDLEAAAPASRLTEGIGRFLERRAVPILVAAAVVAGASVFGITRLVVETNRLEYFRQTDPLRMAYERIEEQFGGLTEIDVVLRGGEPGWLTADAVWRLAALEESLTAMDDIDGSLSLVDLLKHLNQVLAGAHALPSEPASVGALLQLTAAGGGEWSAMFLGKDRPVTRLILFTRQKGSAHLERLIGQVREVVGREAPAGATVEITGSAVVFAGMVRYVVAGQVYGLLVVIGILFVIMSGLARRVTAGFVCLVPTVVPILMLYGTMAATGIPLNLHTSVVSALAAGMAIDNAIHMLSAFKREYRRLGDYRAAVRRSIDIIGRALIVNGLLLAGGLGSFTQGALLPVMQFGLLLAFTMVNALIMGLFLLPALMLVLRPRIG